MTNPNKRKGSSFEQQGVDHFRANGFPYAERRVQGGSNDRGDLGGVPGVMVEFKNHKTMDLAGWMDEVRAEKANAHAQIGVAIVKRRNQPIGRAYVVMEFDEFLNLIH